MKIIKQTLNSILLICLVTFSAITANAQSWQTLGTSGFSPSSVYATATAVNNAIPYIAYEDRANGSRISVKKFNGTNWVNVGIPGFSNGAVQYVNLVFNGNTPYVSFSDLSYSQKATVMKFDGTNWVNVGNAAFSAGTANFTSMAFGGSTPYVTYQDGGNGGRETVMKFDGNNWLNVGNAGFTIPGASYNTIAIDGTTPYVVYQDYNNTKAVNVMKFNGTNWVAVGNSNFSVADGWGNSISINAGVPYVIYADGANSYKATVKKFDGINWVTVGNAGLSLGPVSFQTIAFNGTTPYIVYKDDGLAGKVVVSKFNGTNWATVGGASASTGSTNHCSFAVDGNTIYVGYQDADNGDAATVRKYIDCSSTSSTTNASICAGGSYSFNGSNYNATGTFTKTLTNAAGCDSVATLVLTVKTTSTSTTNVSICPSALPYSWNGSRASAGTYIYTTTNSQGCDSVATLNLTVKTNTTSTTNTTICSSQLPYSWNGSITSVGTYIYTTTNSQGCDSVATLNLTINASPVISSTNNALSFNGTNNYVSIPNSYPATDNITYETWLNASSFNLGDFNVLLAHDGWAYGYIHFQFQGGFLHFDVNGIGNISTNYAFNINTWYHVAVTYSKSLGLIKFYVNGNLSSTYPFSNGPSIAGGIPKTMGTFSNQRFFNGKIDEFRVWNVVRTQAEIQSSMNTELLGNEAGLVEYYNFNQGIAGGNNSSVTTLLDKTTSGHNGTLNNFTLSGSTSNWTSNTNLATVYAAGTQTVCMGTAATSFSPTVTGATSYQWYSNTTLSTSGSTLISGANAASYTAPTTIAGTKYYYLVASNGVCSATSSIQTVITKPTSTSTTNLTICNSALPYVWNGLTFNAAGSKTKTGLTNSAGCDSTATLNLVVKANYIVTASASSNGSISNAGASTICSGNSSTTYSITPNSGYNIAEVLVDGVSQGAITTYSFSNVTANHTIVASFTLSCTPSTSSTAQTACVSYTWNGVTYTTGGTYFKTFTAGNAKGCDSTATLNLTINSATTSSSNQTQCGGSYLWNGVTYTTSGTYFKTFTAGNAKGCDSTATLNLTINSATTSTSSKTQCGGSYLWNGVTYTTSGTFFKTFTAGNAKGCDSVATLNLTINSATTSTSSKTQCGGSYLWNGVTYTTSGTYFKTFTAGNAKGCDSTATLNLTINSATTSTSSQTQCGGSYLWNGVTYTTSGTYFKTFTAGNAKGCDSTATLNLTINSATTSTSSQTQCGGSYLWNGVTYTTSGTYFKTFTAGNAKGCDSVATLNLTINSSPVISSTGNALSFNGINNYVSIPIGYAATDDITYETWLNANSFSGFNVLLAHDNWANGYIHFQFNGGVLHFDVNGIGSGDIGTNYSFNTNTWYHVAVTYSKSLGLIKFYVNGNLSSTYPFSNGPSIAGGIPKTMGTFSNQRFFNGKIDEFRVWNVVRTQAEIQSSMNTELLGNEAGLVEYYNFNQGVAGGNNSGITTLLNNTGSGNTGTLNNFTLSGSTSNWVSNPNLATAYAAGTQAVCMGTAATSFSPTVTGATSYQWYSNTILSTSGSTPISGANAASYTAPTTIAGTKYYYLEAVMAAGCNVQSSIQTVVTKPTSTSTTNLTICNSALPYVWNGLIFNVAGSQTKTGLTNSAGCDSTATLNLTLKTNYTVTASAGSNGIISNAGVSTICSGNSSATYSITPNTGYHIAEVLIDGVSQGAITTYSFSNVTANHTIAASFTLSCTPSTSSTAQTACVSYTWNGVTYTTSGTYSKIFTAGNAKGCDSTAILNLTVKTTTSSTQNIAVCSSALPYSWNGSRTAAGTYTFTTTSSEGCDSVATLNLTVNSFPTVGIIANGANTICNGSSVSLKLVRTTVGNVCATQVENGTFQIQAPPNAVFTSIVFASFGTPNGSCGSFSIGGCHSSNSVSVVSGYLLGNNSASFVVSNGVFGGDPCILIGKSLYVEAQYTIYDTTGLTNLWSTNAVTASITVNPNVTTTYTVVAKDVNGCTGTANKTIVVKATSTSTTSVSICSSALPYSWNGNRTAAGIYTFTTTNSQGCDSVATLNLTVKTNTTSTTSVSICSSALPYSWNGNRTDAGTYTFTTTNSQGCDSVATLYLSVKTSTASTTSISICQSSFPYNWNGLSFTAAGSQTKAGFVNSQGCDSSATLNLTVKTGKSSTSNISICATALPYNWNGSKTVAGTYTFTTNIGQGCDSVATLNLTVKTTTSSTQNIAVCSSSLPYNWNGNRTAAGTYTFTTTNSQGCDSVATLILTIRTNTSSINNIIICSSALPFSWNGLNFNAAGSQTKTGLLNSQGCDSSATLNLTVKTITTSTTIINICSNLLPYSWNGSRTTSGTYTFNTTNSQGCDSVATLNLTVKQQTSSSNIASVCSNQLPYIWNGLSFAAAGSQTKTGLVNSVGCDSSATLILSVSTSSTTSISISGTATSICEGASITFTATPVNGGTAPIYQWKKNGINVGTNTNTFSNNLLASGDSIWCILSSNSACVNNSSSTSNKVRVLVNANPAITPIITGLSPFETVILCKLNTTYRYDNLTPNGVWTTSDSTIASVTGVGKTCILTTKSSGYAIVRYTVTNTFGCSSSATVFFGVFPQEVPKAIIGNDNICVNTISALSCTSPYNSTGYWQCLDGRGSITQSGVYTAKAAGVGVVVYSVTNNSTGCSAYTSISINIHSLPSVPFVYYADGTIVNPQTGSNGSFCANRTFTVVGNPSGGIWSKTGVLTVGANSGVVNTGNVAGAGSLIYTTTNVKGCSNSRAINGNVAVCASRGVNGGTASSDMPVASGDFTMYPNPAKSFISLNVNSLIGAGSIVVTDLYGKQVKVQSLSMGTNTIDVSKFSKGIYFVSTITIGGKTTKKLVVE